MWRDDAYLLDMLKAARRVIKYVSGLSSEDFEKNELTQDAVVRNLEIIGEAASKISPETRNTHTELAWNEIIGMRNLLIHEYFRVNLTRVWDTITNDIPRLVSFLEEIVPPKEEE